MALTWDVICRKCKASFQIYDDEASYLTENNLDPDCGCQSESDEVGVVDKDVA